MSRYINADALIECLERHLPSNMKRISNEYEAAVGDGLEQAIYVVEDFEAADVRPNVRGEWKKVADKAEHITYECVFCGAKVHVARNVVTPNFCNRCGADMRKKGEE